MATKTGINSDVLTRLEEADWGSLYVKLVRYAEFKVRSLTFVIGGGELPLGRTPEDLVEDAIKRVFEGKRKWNPERDPDLFEYLKSVISSLQNALLQQAAYQNRDGQPVEGLNVPDRIFSAEYNDCLDAFIQICNDACADDNDLDDVFTGLEDGMKSREISEFFSIPIERVYSLTQKLRRHIEKAMEQHPCSEHWKSIREAS